MTHELKITPEYFQDIQYRVKTFEIRYNDRNYQIGDVLLLREFNKHSGYTGQSVSVTVTYITDFQQKDGYVVMGIRF